MQVSLKNGIWAQNEVGLSTILLIQSNNPDLQMGIICIYHSNYFIISFREMYHDIWIPVSFTTGGQESGRSK